LILKMVLIALGIFIVVFFAAYKKSGDTLTLAEMLPFLIFVGLNLLGFMIGRSLPARTLGVFAGINVLLLLIAINSTGSIAMWTIIGMGLFNSIMWSNIFTLAIEGLGKYTSQASSVLVMMILGGALVPLIQGAVADSTGDLQFSMIVPIFCYLYLVFYGLKGANIGKDKVKA
ncbi:MAG: MFS transporter, partial [Bacteroidota bacterium]